MRTERPRGEQNNEPLGSGAFSPPGAICPFLDLSTDGFFLRAGALSPAAMKHCEGTGRASCNTSECLGFGFLVANQVWLRGPCLPARKLNVNLAYVMHRCLSQPREKPQPLFTRVCPGCLHHHTGDIPVGELENAKCAA